MGQILFFLLERMKNWNQLVKQIEMKRIYQGMFLPETRLWVTVLILWFHIQGQDRNSTAEDRKAMKGM